MVALSPLAQSALQSGFLSRETFGLPPAQQGLLGELSPELLMQILSRPFTPQRPAIFNQINRGVGQSPPPAAAAPPPQAPGLASVLSDVDLIQQANVPQPLKSLAQDILNRRGRLPRSRRRFFEGALDGAG